MGYVITKNALLILSTIKQNPKMLGYYLAPKAGMRTPTIYPILRKLHDMGLIVSVFAGKTTAGIDKKEYSLTDQGEALIFALEKSIKQIPVKPKKVKRWIF